MKQTRSVRWFKLPMPNISRDIRDTREGAGELTREQSDALLICIFDSLWDEAYQPRDQRLRSEGASL